MEGRNMEWVGKNVQKVLFELSNQCKDQDQSRFYVNVVITRRGMRILGKATTTVYAMAENTESVK